MNTLFRIIQVLCNALHEALCDWLTESLCCELHACDGRRIHDCRNTESQGQKPNCGHTEVAHNRSESSTKLHGEGKTKLQGELFVVGERSNKTIFIQQGDKCILLNNVYMCSPIFFCTPSKKRVVSQQSPFTVPPPTVSSSFAVTTQHLEC